MINMRQWVQDVINSPVRITIPIMTNPGIEVSGYTVEKAVKNGRVHFDAIYKLNEKYPIAAACTSIMDLTVEAEAFGSQISFSENEVPNVIGRLISDYEGVEALKVPSLQTGRVPEYLKANKLAADYITNKPVFAGCIGPFSLAGRLYDMSNMMIALYTEPETIQLLLEKCTRFITEYIHAIKETGVNGVIIAEPAAGLVSNEDCSQYSSLYIRKIVEGIQDENFMIVLHNCGNTGHCTAAMVETRSAGLHFGNKIDMAQALKECPTDILVMGNIDPVGVLQQETPEKIKQETLELLHLTAGSKNFVLSTGCDVPPLIPVENIEAYYNALDEFNRK
ncbi:MAG: uroporphyrinogen decarboxylase family protein [Parabacteroides sp.]|nr:uroporphyrinogen decarboxylase family protein [Parabacteroides sp.]